MLLSCGEKNNPDPGNGDDPDPEQETDVINGTTIDQENNNVCGLITDTSGNPIAGVPVTDGYKFVVTDANGVYQMSANRYARKIYYSTPAGYEVNLNSITHLPEFFSTTSISRSTMNRFDFTLTPLSASETNFTLVMVGDPQCKTSDNAQRYKNETIPDIQSTISSGQTAGKYPNVYAFTLGDIVFDSSNLWGTMKTSMSNVKNPNGGYIPFFNCIGNHDHYSKASDDYNATEYYVTNFGPTDYSLDRGNAHIVVMDNVICLTSSTNSSPDGATWDYLGGYSEKQYEWLKADLDLVQDKENKLLIFCSHIPFRGGLDASKESGSSVRKDKYYAEILSLMTDFKEAHIMIGHTHYSQNWIHTGYKCKGGQPVYEHVHGAACGAWWAADSDVIGGPNGYNIYEIEGASVKNWFTKGTGEKDDFQLRVYDGNQTYTGTAGYTYNWYNTANKGGSSSITAKGNASLKGCFVAQIWDDDDANWKVELYKDGAKVGNFTRLANGSCANIAVCAYWFNEKSKNTSTWTSTTASHYWYYKPSSGEPSSESGWEVRATQTIPASGQQNVYTCSSLTTDIQSAF